MSEIVIHPESNPPGGYSQLAAGTIYRKDSDEKGAPVKIECIDINGKTYIIKRGLVTIVGLEDYWYEDQHDSEKIIAALKQHPELRADIFTFWQRPAGESLHFDYHVENEKVAMVTIPSYTQWWEKQIKSKVRGLIKKSEKEGVMVRETVFDDDFIRGLTRIFNESPTRQGRKFWHYGKDFDTVKRQFSRYMDREIMLAAYFEGEIVGVVMLGNAGRFGLLGQIISTLEHRDKSINNVLIAKSVEICESQGLGHLCYYYWSDDSLGEFKSRSGFKPINLPRYYVPLTLRGQLALKIGLHRGWRAMIPSEMKKRLKGWRRRFNERNSEIEKE